MRFTRFFTFIFTAILLWIAAPGLGEEDPKPEFAEQLSVALSWPERAGGLLRIISSCVAGYRDPLLICSYWRNSHVGLLLSKTQKACRVEA